MLICDGPVVSSGGNQSTRQETQPNSKSMATFTHAPAGIRNRAVVRDGKQMVGHPNNHITIKQKFMAMNGHKVIE